MKDAYEVYPSRLRIYMTTIVFVLFGLAICGVAFTGTWIIMKIVAVAFGLLFFYAAFETAKKGLGKRPDYVFDDRGITDNTQNPTVVVPWADILKIEMTPNNAVMQIGILARKTVVSQDEKSVVLARNLVSNGNMAFYSIMIDGFKFRQKQFLNIFEELQRQGVKHNPSILVNKVLEKKR